MPRRLRWLVVFAAGVSLSFPGAAVAAPANDNFADAAVLTGFPVSASGSNVDATAEPGEPNHYPGTYTNPGHSVWWTWTAPSSTAVQVDTCGSGSWNTVAVYTGTSVDDLTAVERAVFTATGCPGRGATATFKAVAGQVYRIAVDTNAVDLGYSGDISLQLTEPPANDDFANAAAITGFPASVSGNNFGATSEPGEPAGNSSVWWTWTAPSTRDVQVETCGTAFANQVDIYTGNSVDSLTAVAHTSPIYMSSGCASTVTFRAIAGGIYRLRVDGWASDNSRGMGDISLHVNAPPANDDFANAASLGGLSASASASNFGASKEAGEPNHAGMPGGQSLWWRWTAPANGEVSIDTCDSRPASGGDIFVTQLAVYAGTTVGSLTEIDSSDGLDYTSTNCSPHGAVDFDAVRGRAYRIAVDSGFLWGGWIPVAGDVKLRLDEEPAPAPGPSPAPAPSPRPTPAPAFGPKALVLLKLAAKRFSARGPLKITITNRNGFTVTGKLTGRTTRKVSVSRRRVVMLKSKAFRIGPQSRKTLRFKLPKTLRRLLKRKHKLSLRLAAKVKDPAGHTRRLTRRVTVRLKTAR